MVRGVKLQIGTKDAKRASREWKAMAKRQMPFAISRAINDVAIDARRNVVQKFPRHFKVRRKNLAKSAIWVKRSHKNQKPITAIVGTRKWAEFLTLQAIGGTKKAKRGHRLTIPTRLVKRTSTGRIRKADKPRTLRDKPGFQAKELEEKQRITVRPKRRRKTTGKLGIFSLLRKRVKIRKRWPIRREVKEVAARRIGPAFELRLRQAIKSAKQK